MGERSSERDALDLTRAIAGAVVPLAAIGATMLEAALDILPANGLVDRLTLGRLLIVLAVVALLAAGARLEHFRTGADVAIGLLILAAVFTTVQGGWDGAPLRFLITAVATYYVVVATIRRLPDARSAIALVAMIGVVATAGLGIAQVAEESFTGFYRDGLEPVTSEIVRPDLQVRAIGTFTNPNLLASFLVLLGPIGLATAAWLGRREMRWAVFGLTALVYIGLVLTFSRSAVLGAILGGLLVILLLPAASPIRRAAIWTAAGLAVAAIAAAAATSGRAVGAFGRFEAWDLALEAAADEPVNGVGLGRSGDVIAALGGTDETFAHAHNLWLSWLTEAGPVAFLAIAFLSIWLVVEAARGTRRGDAFMAAALAGMVGFLVISLTDHPANAERIAITFWVLAGIIAASSAPSLLAPWLGGPDDGEVERPPPVVLAAAAPAVATQAPAADAVPAPVVAPPSEPDPTPEEAEDTIDEPAPRPVADESAVAEPPSGPGASTPVIVPLDEPDGESADDQAGGARPKTSAPDEPAEDPADATAAADVEASEPEVAAPQPSEAQEEADAEASGETEPQATPDADAGEPVSEPERSPDDAREPLGEEIDQPLPPLFVGAREEDGLGADHDSADTGEIPRPPELVPDLEEQIETDAPDETGLETDGPQDSALDPEPEMPAPSLFGLSTEDDASEARDDPDEERPSGAEVAAPGREEQSPASGGEARSGEPVDEDSPPGSVSEEPADPPFLFFDQEAEADATEVGPLGVPPVDRKDPEPEPVGLSEGSGEAAPPTPEPGAASDPAGDASEPAVEAEDQSDAGEASEPVEGPEPGRRGSVNAWITFESVADELRADPAVTSSTMMAAPSLRRDGTYFAALWHDSRLAVKLPLARSRAMIDEGVAEEFAPAGRTLDEWVLVAPDSLEQWRALLEEAKAHAASS